MLGPLAKKFQEASPAGIHHNYVINNLTPTKKLGTQLTLWLAELDTLLGRLVNVKHEHKQQNIECKLKNGIIVSHLLIFSTLHCLAFFLICTPRVISPLYFYGGLLLLSLHFFKLDHADTYCASEWSQVVRTLWRGQSLLGAWGTKQLPPFPGGKWCLCQHHSLINTLEVICLICIIGIFFHHCRSKKIIFINMVWVFLVFFSLLFGLDWRLV